MAFPWPIIAVVVVLIMIGLTGIHKVEEGHVGLYWVGGALLEQITDPGYHYRLPITTFRSVQITLQTDQVRNIPCGTNGGVILYFDKIEAVNRLKRNLVYETIKNYTINYDKTWIFDKIHHAINEICTPSTLEDVYITKFHTLDEQLKQKLQISLDLWAPGIEVFSIRVTKPRIPEAIRRNYEKMEQEKTQLLVATQRQRVVEEEAETALQKAVIEAEKKKEVAKIGVLKDVEKKQKQYEMSLIENEVHLAKEKALADARVYKAQKQALGNHLVFTQDFLKLHATQAITKNTKVFFGNQLPKSLYITPQMLNME